MSPPKELQQPRGVSPWAQQQTATGVAPAVEQPADNGGNWGGADANAELAAPAAHEQGPSDWLSFNQYMGVAGPEMQQRIAQAQAQQQGYEEQAQAALTQSGWQAQQQHLGNIQQTASYGDFLKAKAAGEAAANAWRSYSANPYTAALENMYAPKGGPQFNNMLNSANNQARSGQQNYRQGQQANAAAKAAEAAKQQAEQASQDQFFQNNYGQTQAEYQQGQLNAASGNPYANTDSGSTYPGGQTYAQYQSNLENGYKKPIY